MNVPRGMIIGLLLNVGVVACAPSPPMGPTPEAADPAPDLPTYLIVVNLSDEHIGLFARHAERDWPLGQAAPQDTSAMPLPTEVLAPGDTLWAVLSLLPGGVPAPIPTPLLVKRGESNWVWIHRIRLGPGRIGG